MKKRFCILFDIKKRDRRRPPFREERRLSLSKSTKKSCSSLAEASSNSLSMFLRPRSRSRWPPPSVFSGRTSSAPKRLFIPRARSSSRDTGFIVGQDRSPSRPALSFFLRVRSQSRPPRLLLDGTRSSSRVPLFFLGQVWSPSQPALCESARVRS